METFLLRHTCPLINVESEQSGNNDYNILALILARRIKIVMYSIIDEAQSGFMPNRHISNNVRLVLDLLDYFRKRFSLFFQDLIFY